MRRALRGIVPDELLDRRRKAFVSRAPRAAISEQFDNFANMAGQMICSGLEVIDAAKLLEALRSAPHDPEVSIVSLIRTLRMEAWLRALQPWAHRVVLSA
jgi:asparagine synthase (glutamine-hydrolysing)